MSKDDDIKTEKGRKEAPRPERRDVETERPSEPRPRPRPENG